MKEFEEVTFERLFSEPLRNGIYKAKEFHGRGTPILNMGDLFAFDHIRTAPTATLEVTASEFERFSVRQGDLLFGRRSLVLEGSGKCSIVEDVGECVFESSLIRVRLDPDRGDPDYFFAFFSSPQGRARVLSIASQTAVSGIRGSDLARLPVPAPPIHVQRAVGGTIRSFDDLIDVNSRRIAVLEELVRGVYQQRREPHTRSSEHARSSSEVSQRAVFGDLVDVVRESAAPGEIPDDGVLAGC